jgi:methylthioribose-1-phosphate isomerase
VPYDSPRYGAHLDPPARESDVVSIENAADLLAQTVDLLVRRAPSIVAAAASELDSTVLALHFGDGSDATLFAQLNSLAVTRTRA